MLNKTKSWWSNLLTNTYNINTWVTKLYQSKYEADIRMVELANKYYKNDIDSYDLIMKISSQKKKQLTVIKKFLNKRNIYYMSPKITSKYLDSILKAAVDKETSISIAALSEALCLKRIRYIAKCSETPDDIKALMLKIMTDDMMHARLIAQLATRKGMKAVYNDYSLALKEL